MHGNVWEWCHDYFGRHYYGHSPERDPPGPSTGSFRVLRGGSWGYPARYTRSAARDGDVADLRSGSLGFRLVRELDDPVQTAPPTQPLPSNPPVIELPSITNTNGMKLNKIPAGTFMMGSPEDETGRYKYEHQHKVTISKAFYMQTTEVTQGQWKAVMGTEPWKGYGNVKYAAYYAATQVTRGDAIVFCEKLSKKEGKTYRLPTEAEWEYACRAGTETAWSFGDDEGSLGDYAWCKENTFGGQYAHEVGLKKPNAFGLYDMHGNVWEWCHDYYGEDYYKNSPEKDPTGPSDYRSFRVIRGGSRNNISRDSRSAFRGSQLSTFTDYDSVGGFRVVRELD